MSAAATAAGYLYASGRLRGRAAKEQEHEHGHDEHGHEHEQPPQKRAKTPEPEKIRVAVYPKQERAEKPRRTPKIEYRRRRWSPE